MRKKRNFNTDIFMSISLQNAEEKNSIAVKWLFLGLISLADREGRLESDERILKNKILPFSSVTLQEITNMMNSLEEFGSIINYQKDGKKYCQVKSFTSNQYILKTEKASVLPKNEVF